VEKEDSNPNGKITLEVSFVGDLGILITFVCGQPGNVNRCRRGDLPVVVVWTLIKFKA